MLAFFFSRSSDLMVCEVNFSRAQKIGSCLNAFFSGCIDEKQLLLMPIACVVVQIEFIENAEDFVSLKSIH